MNKLHMTETARKDLHQIKRYIAETLENPRAALSMVTKIAKDIRMLRKYPQIGPPLASIAQGETDAYRFLVSGRYMVFYRVIEGAVYVDRVLYGRSDYLHFLLNGKPPAETDGEAPDPEA